MIIDAKDINRILLPRLLALITCNDGIGGIDATPSDMMIPVSSSPSMVAIVLDPANKIFQDVLRQEEFVINILPKEYSKKMLDCAKNCPRGIDKLEQAGLNHYSSEKADTKRVREAKIWVGCKLLSRMKVGENMVVFGEAVAIEADESVVVEGKVDVAKSNPPLRISESVFSEARGERTWV